MALNYRGHFTCYFNRHSDAPRVWCVASQDQSWEINVASIDMLGVRLHSRYLPTIPPPTDQHDGPPSAYFVGEGEITVSEDGHAVIVPLVGTWQTA